MKLRCLADLALHAFFGLIAGNVIGVFFGLPEIILPTLLVLLPVVLIVLIVGLFGTTQATDAGDLGSSAGCSRWSAATAFGLAMIFRAAYLYRALQSPGL